MIEKKVKMKESSQEKGGKRYSAKQFYIYFNQQDANLLHLEPDKIIYLTDVPTNGSPALQSNLDLLQDLYQLMVQKMQPTQSLNKDDQTFLEKLEEVLKHE